MNLFDQETLRVLKALQTNEVCYLLIGAMPLTFTAATDPPLTWIFG
jgi:hypothetical protein